MEQGSDVRRWIYVSHCLLGADEVDGGIEDIVAVSRARNATLGVTGALLCSAGCFAQLIEGPAPAITELQASILADARHGRVTTLADGPAARRSFAGWALVYAGHSHYLGAILTKVRLGADTQEPGVAADVAAMFEAFARDAA